MVSQHGKSMFLHSAVSGVRGQYVDAWYKELGADQLGLYGPNEDTAEDCQLHVESQLVSLGCALKI